MTKPGIYRLSERAVTIAWEPVISIEVNEQVLKADQLIRKQPFGGWIENVPAYHTLTVYYDPVLLDVAIIDHLAKIAASELPAEEAKERLVEIPVYYDPEKAPDLLEAAKLLNTRVSDLIELHSSNVYHVFMLGFMPGFPYMGTLPDQLELHRKAVPSKKMSAGTVAIAGKQTGIYPFDSPGGWYAIGWTPINMFSEGRSFLEPGDKVKFVPQWG